MKVPVPALLHMDTWTTGRVIGVLAYELSPVPEKMWKSAHVRNEKVAYGAN